MDLKKKETRGTGDHGISDLNNRIRLSKTSIYFQVIGDIDELNCQIGIARSCLDLENFITIHEKLYNIQKVLEIIINLIVTPPWHELKPLKGDTEQVIDDWVEKYRLPDDAIEFLENFINSCDKLFSTGKNRIKDTPFIRHLNLCRAITRRCERKYLEFLDSDLICYGVYDTIDICFNEVKVYLNRLSDFFELLMLKVSN